MPQQPPAANQAAPKRLARRWPWLGLMAFLATASLGACANSNANSPSNEAQRVVDRSTLSVESLLGDNSGQAQNARQFLKRAKAVVVCPRIFRAGFVFGGEGGECVLVSRAANGSWSDPAFYSMGSGSFGLQIGAQDAEVMIFLMNDTALQAFLNSQFKLGADAGVSVATIGTGIGGSTGTAFGADMVTVAKSRGFYGGISLSGSVFSNDSALDQQYYGKSVGARSIVVRMSVSNPGANPLRAMLGKYGS